MIQGSRRFLAIVALLLMAGILLRPVVQTHAARNQVQADTFVGKVDGTDAFIGITSDGTNVLAYICDGQNNTTGDYFHGTVSQASNGSLTLTADDNSDQLVIMADATTLPGLLAPGNNITGTFTNGDGTFTFSTEPAIDPAGLYQAGQTLTDGTELEGGTVVLNDGEMRGSTTIARFGTPTNIGFGFGNTGNPLLSPNTFVVNNTLTTFGTTLLRGPNQFGGPSLFLMLNTGMVPLPFLRQGATTLNTVPLTLVTMSRVLTITLNVTDDRFDVTDLTVPLGTLVTLVLRNNGRTFHNWHLVGARRSDGTFVQTRMLFGGETDTITFAISQPGVFIFQDDANPGRFRGTIRVS